MRLTLTVLVASAIFATSAIAQETENMQNVTVPSNIAGPEANIAINATNEAVANGLTNEPAPVAIPPMVEDPEATDVNVTTDTNGGGFPWGLLGLIGLIGLIGRRRS